MASTTTRGRRAQRHRSAAGHDGDADLGRAHARAGGQDGLAGADVVARGAQVAAGRRPRRRGSRVSPSTVTSSTCSTASAPSGIAAPVEIRTASPSPTPTAAGAPARDSPTMRSARPAGPDRTAKPSIALLANEGTSRSATTSSASTRPSASWTATSSDGQRAHGGEHLARAPRRSVRAMARSSAAVGRGWYPGWRCPRPRSAPGARIRSPTCRPQRSRTARRRPRAGCSRSWPRGRCATRRRCRSPTSRATPRRCARRSCARSAPTPSCAGWSAAATSPASRRARASWRARAARRPRWRRSRRCAPRCGRR